MATNDLAKYIGEAHEEWNQPNAKIAGIPSSPHYDAKLITWHLLYWGGQEPKDIGSGRGHSYNVILRNGRKCSVRITNYNDHREGVVGIR